MRLNELRQIDVPDPISLLDHIAAGHDKFGIVVCDLFQRPVFTLFRFPAVHDRHGHLHISILHLLMNGKFCGEAWDAVSRYVYVALQGGSIMKGWTNDDRMMIACCNDGTRPVIFKIERIDIPENNEEREWLAKQNFKNSAEDAYTG